jgi:uncharacterized protein YbcC (UPF0753/DUF2309 family)
MMGNEIKFINKIGNFYFRFKEKYHPDESKTHKKVKEAFLRERFAAWKKLHEADMLKDVVFDLEHDQKLAKALDAAIMVMENIALSDIEAFMNDGKSTQPETKKTGMYLLSRYPNNFKNEQKNG